jgi:signal peptide peptidase SppA
MKTGTQLWAGTDESFQQWLEATIKANADTNFKADREYEDEVMSKILHVDGNIAVINVSGSLVDGSAGWLVYYGVTGYNDIRNALVKAVSDPNVGGILLNVRSGGGAVAGCHETSQLLARVNKIKPVVTYTGSAMCSAALWLGSQASYAVAAETAMVGSLGIIMVHADRSEQLKLDGIKATIIRAGSEKALASPYEPLSEQALKQLQAQADQLYGIFLGQVAAGRGIDAATADANFGQGREFIGKSAKKSGLVDAVGTYEDAMLKAQNLAKKPATTSVKSRYGATNQSVVQLAASTAAAPMADNGDSPQGNPMPPIQSLSEVQLAAMAAGIDLPEVEAKAAEPAEPAAPAAPAAAPAAAVPTTEATAAAPPVSETVTVLQGMLANANSDLVTARMEANKAQEDLKNLQAAQTAAAAQTEALTEVARASVRTMGLHFGVNKESVAAMSPTEVLAEHGRLSAMFRDKFKVGGVAASAAKTDTEAAAAPSMSASESQAAMKLPRAR